MYNIPNKMIFKPFAVGAFVALIAGSIHCGDSDKGGESQVYKGIEASIRELNLDDALALDSLVETINERSYKDPCKVVDLLHCDSEEDAEKAAAVVLAMGNLALTPLLEKLDKNTPENLVWEMQTAVSVQLDNRSRIVKLLDEMLLDKTPLEPPVFPMDAEELPQPRRVCDEAYLMMRQLFTLEDEETELMNIEAFLDMTDEERDTEIERAEKTQKWISLVEQAFEGEEL